MKILHTADWHLGDRLGRIDRTDDLRRAVERVAEYCDLHEVDVLLVAGDLFSEMLRPDGLRDAIRHLQSTFAGFLGRGGTILTLTGNHDNENFCQTLRHAMNLAAPMSDRPGERVASGRFYLATAPTLLRLADRELGQDVQFLLMPYPTTARYFDPASPPRYSTLEERNRLLQTAYNETLKKMRADPSFDPKLQTVLAAHVTIFGSDLETLFRITQEEDIVLTDVPTEFAYVALGHIHRPQCISKQSHVRYSGSIERLDLGETSDEKGVVLVEIGPEGRRGEPLVFPLDSTPVYRVEMKTPLKDALAQLREEHPDAKNDLVRIDFTYTAGVDNLETVLAELEEIFPRWYARNWSEATALRETLTVGEASRGKSFEDTVRDYLKQELLNHSEEDREAVLHRAETLMKEVGQ